MNQLTFYLIAFVDTKHLDQINQIYARTTFESRWNCLIQKLSSSHEHDRESPVICHSVDVSVAVVIWQVTWACVTAFNVLLSGWNVAPEK